MGEVVTVRSSRRRLDEQSPRPASTSTVAPSAFQVAVRAHALIRETLYKQLAEEIN
jgi:hypothetical protein